MITETYIKKLLIQADEEHSQYQTSFAFKVTNTVNTQGQGKRQCTFQIIYFRFEVSDPISTQNVLFILLLNKLTLLLFLQMRLCISSLGKYPMVQYITEKQFVEVWREKKINVFLHQGKHLFVKQVMKMKPFKYILQEFISILISFANLASGFSRQTVSSFSDMNGVWQEKKS